MGVPSLGEGSRPISSSGDSEPLLTKVGRVKKQLKRAVATAAVCAVGATGTLSYLPSAHADEAASTTTSSSSKPVATQFGREAWAWGTKVLANGIDVFSLKDAQAKQHCTDLAGLSSVANSVASVTSYLPQELQDLVSISPVTSTTQTYQDKAAGIDGVRATSTIADVQIGGNTVGGVTLPKLSIEGLTSVADSFHAANASKKWDTNESFAFQGMKIDYDGSVVDGTPLADLLDILNQVAAPVTQIVNQVIQLLQSVGKVTIPGLAEISLGTAYHKITDNSAASKAYALRINLFPATDRLGDVLELGQAKSRISAPLTSAFFRSNMMGLDLAAGNDLLHLGGIQRRTIPCEGTSGQTLSKHVDSSSFPLAIPGVSDTALVDLSDITYAYSGQQLSRGRAKGMVSSSLGTLKIPALGLEVQGLKTVINLFRPSATAAVQKRRTVTVGDILVDGKSLLGGVKPVLGKIYEFVDKLTGDTNVIQFGAAIPKADNRSGTGVEGIRLTIPGLATKLSIGWAQAHILPLGKIKGAR